MYLPLEADVSTGSMDVTELRRPIEPAEGNLLVRPTETTQL
jgi:hypothetical protein